MYTRSFWRCLPVLAISWLLPSGILAQDAPAPAEPQLTKPSIVYKVQSPDDRLEMIIRTSRILTTKKGIVQIEPGNRDILEMTTLSPTQIQITGKAMGVTQVSLWDEDKKLYTINVRVVGDSRELAMVLQAEFPNSALKVTTVSSAVMISGEVDKNEYIERIMRIAEQYYPTVINGMTVGGVEQVLLHCKVMEVSRTKLRKLGFDWGKITGSNIVSSTPAGLLSDSNPGGLTSPPSLFRTATPATFSWNVSGPGSAFFGVLEAMRQDNLMKIMSEPTLVAISGQEASFNSGGQIPVPTPQSLGTLSITWQNYGTHIKFIPIVLGAGKIRLQVQPLISELDYSTSTTIQGTTVPGIKSRDASTSVEMMAGQTLAIAGLVQSRIEAENGGLPWISDLPYLGAAFRTVREQRNEVELLILVTPELVDALDADEVPPCGPGMQTTSPSDWELYMKGHLEVPRCPTGDGCANGDCGKNEGGSCDASPNGVNGPAGEEIPAPQSNNGNTSPKPHNRQSPTKPNSSASAPSSGSPNNPPGFIGPVGYDVVK
jgi:pilus assembly protein CpaC